MTPRERHEALAASCSDCLCRGLPGGPRRRLCGASSPGGLTCGRPAGHAGLHLACGGLEGPHALASWGRLEEPEIPLKS